MRLTTVLFWLALVVWCAAALATPAAAVAAFRTLPELGLSVSGLEPYFGADTKAAGQFVAGRMLQPLFDGTDWVQMFAAALTVSTSIRLWRLRGFAGPAWLGSVTVALVVLAGALVAVRLTHAAGARVDLAEYWNAIADHDHAAAAPAKERFDASHQVAVRLAAVQTALLLSAVAAAAAACSPKPSAAQRAA